MTREQWPAAYQAWTDSWDAIGPHTGPCGLCGHPDARHRVADTWTERHTAGDPIAGIAADFDRDPADVQAVILLGLAAAQLRDGPPGEEVPHQPP